MNERIRELAEQAHEYVAFSNAKDLRKVFEKKFAELIIRECVAQVEDDDNAFDILKHFGVE